MAAAGFISLGDQPLHESLAVVMHVLVVALKPDSMTSAVSGTIARRDTAAIDSLVYYCDECTS
jgi:hypothetical protein